MRTRVGVRTVIGEYISKVEAIFKPVFNATDVSGDGREFDRLVREGEKLPLDAHQVVDAVRGRHHLHAGLRHGAGGLPDGDATFAAPVLLRPSVQMNMHAGNLLPPDITGTRYLRVPVRGAGLDGRVLIRPARNLYPFAEWRSSSSRRSTPRISA